MENYECDGTAYTGEFYFDGEYSHEVAFVSLFQLKQLTCCTTAIVKGQH